MASGGRVVVNFRSDDSRFRVQSNETQCLQGLLGNQTAYPFTRDIHCRAKCCRQERNTPYHWSTNTSFYSLSLLSTPIAILCHSNSTISSSSSAINVYPSSLFTCTHETTNIFHKKKKKKKNQKRKNLKFTLKDQETLKSITILSRAFRFYMQRALSSGHSLMLRKIKKY